jgi:hypothetical protein
VKHPENSVNRRVHKSDIVEREAKAHPDTPSGANLSARTPPANSGRVHLDFSATPKMPGDYVSAIIDHASHRFEGLQTRSQCRGREREFMRSYADDAQAVFPGRA